MRNTWRTLHMLCERDSSCLTNPKEKCMFVCNRMRFIQISFPFKLPHACHLYFYRCLCDALAPAAYPIFIPRPVSMRIAKHFICIPYLSSNYIMSILLYTISFGRSFFASTHPHSLSLSLYPSLSLYHRYVYVGRWCMHQSYVVCMPRSSVHFISQHHFHFLLYVELTHFLTTGSFSLQVLTQHAHGTNKFIAIARTPL